VEPEATPEREQEVRAAAEALLEEIRGGADFAEVAGRASEDPGSRAQGGDLGFFERGKMVPSFETAAFELEPGQVSEVVRSEFGFHIIRVEAHQQAENRPFEAVKEELAREALASEAASSAIRALAETLAAGVAEGRSLEQAARDRGLTLERSGWLRRRPDGFVPGLGAAQDLIATAFTLSAGDSSDRIFEVGEKLALVQVLETKQADAEAVEARIAETREELLKEKRRAQIEAWLEARRTQLIASGELAVNREAIRSQR
jgi:peptidyl-prolyl cis-trans isomerase D